jgi:hypothetical protein
MSGIPLVLGFERGMASPLDNDFQKANLIARNAIATGRRFEGMQCYVVSEGKLFTLIGGITNNDWQAITDGAAGKPGQTSVGLHSLNIDGAWLDYDAGGAYFDDNLGAVFPAGVVSSMLVKASFPRKWDTESLYCQIDWTHATAGIGNVEFDLTSKCFNNLSPLNVAYSSTVSVTDTGGDDTLRYLTSQSDNIPIGGYPSKNSAVHLRISRPAHDTLAADVYVQRVVLFYESDQPTDDDSSVVAHVLADETNHILYLSSGSKGIETVNITNPVSPILVNSYPVSGRVKKCVIVGAYLYQLDADYGLRIYTITSPGTLSLVSELLIPGARDIAVSGDGNLAFLAGRDNNLIVVNTTTKASPVLISRDNAGVLTSCVGVGVNAGILYVCGNNVYAFDLALYTNDMSAAWLDTYSTADARAISFYGTTAYIAKSGSGIESIDITDPAAMAGLNTYNGTGNALAVVSDGTSVYSADRYSGCRKFSATLAYQAVLDAQNQANSVAVGAVNIYISNAIAGITIADKATMLPISYFTSN